MARIRTIKPEFWDDLKISKISRDSRLLYIGMWNFADDLGVIIGNSIWIKSKVFPYDQIQIQQFDKWILELVQSGFISLFSHNGEEFYYLPNLTRHQVINRPNLDKVNVQQSDLIKIINSRNDHGTILDETLTLKGEERKGKDITPTPTPSPESGVVVVEIEKSWRNNFELYLTDLRKAYKELVIDTAYITERAKYHPGLNIKLSIEKACKDFWATEAGWKNKKKSKSENIDWKKTFNNALNQNCNRVWLREGEENETGTNKTIVYV